MSKPRVLLATAIFAVLAHASSALAQNSAPVVIPADPTPKGQSTSNQSSSFSKFTESLYFSAFSNFHGTSLDKPIDRRTPNVNGYENNRALNMYFDSTVVAAYMLTKDVGIGPEFNFWYVPVAGDGFIIQDSGLRIFDHHFYHNGNFNVSANFIVQGTTGEANRIRGQEFSLKTTPHFRYRLAKSGFTTGAFTEAKNYVGVEIGKTMKVWAEPYVTYDFNDTIGLMLGYEMEAEHLRNKAFFDFQNNHTDLQPSVRWWIKKNLLLNPYINLYTGNKVTAKNSYFGAIISATL